ncbi:MAG: hypothetical protein JW862_18545 [Anaerolineales bacterium]|nr:hypothetical protein [Anaerolineales bacterium]
MLTQYHRQICQRALADEFSLPALEIIIAANVAQDNLRGQIGHPEYHFDDNAFEQGNAYLEQQRRLILTTLANNTDRTPTWQAFGRLTHAAQDFYAHSNYLQLWVEQLPAEADPDPEQVSALDLALLEHPELRSGRIYLPEVLAFIPALRPFTRRILPADAHANMNLDYPERGWLFPYVIEAAVQRTVHEYRQLASRIQWELASAALARFKDR